MMIPQETIARIKALVDPELIIDYLGFHIIRRTPKELRGPCKIHGGDNPTAFRFNLETRKWCCYTRHCEEENYRDLVGLIQKTTGQPFLESVKLLADVAGINLNDQDQLSEEYLRLKYQQEMKKEIKQAQSSVTKGFPEEEVEKLMSGRTDYFIDRGFPAELLDFYQVGGTVDKYGTPRETIPIRDPDGKLLTVSARRTDSDEDPKYYLLENFPKSATLYNLDLAKHYVGLPRVLIIVEGFVDVWRLVLFGVYNVVAVMGTDITPQQADLVSIYADEAIIMLDPDPAGRKAVKRMKKLLESRVGVQVIDLPDDKDPKNFEYSDIKKYFGGMIND